MAHNEQHSETQEFSLKSFFIPFTSVKAIHFIIIIGLIVFGNILFNGFVWDDLGYILTNPQIQTFHLGTLLDKNVFNDGGYYRALSAVYFSLLYTLFGPHAFFFHFFQIALHIANACLVFFLLKRFVSKAIAFFLVLFFLIHPIQVESIAYIGASQSELFFFFGITALFLSMKNKLTWMHLLFLSASLLLSLLTKETGFLFLLLIVLYQVLFKRRLTFQLLSAIFASVAMYCILRFFVAGIFFEKNISSPIGAHTLFERMMTIPAIIFYYLKTLVYPVDLAIDQRWIVTSVDFSHFYFPLVVDMFFFIALGFLGLYVYHVNKKPFRLFLFFLLWFLMGLGMLLQIFPLDMTVADRWFYFPIVGLLGCIGVGIQSMKPIKVQWKKVSTVLVICMLILFSVRTIIRNADWVDVITLYSHDVKREDNYDLQGMLGVELASVGKYREALPHLVKANAEIPNDTNLYDLGNVYEQLGYPERAKQCYNDVITKKNLPYLRDNVKANAYMGMARVLVLRDTPEKSLAFSEKALKLYPKSGTLWSYVAISAYKLKHQEEALRAAEKANSLVPGDTSIKKLYLLIRNKQRIDLR